MQSTVKLADAKAHLSSLVESAEVSGRTFIITKRGVPAAVIAPVKDAKKRPSLRGSLSAYADPAARAREDGAWARDIEARGGDV